ncbi:Translation initiation factor 3 subunit b [Coemansia sp. RSA 1365]|nr:Translation initiation factor 3 subunit b [Coemansia sp. RSA 1365]
MPAYTFENLPASEEEIDYSDLERKFAIPEQEETLENVVVVDNLPIVDSSKEEKLIKVLKNKVFKKSGKVKENGFHMPKADVKGVEKTKGYAFVEFETAEQAQAAIRNVNGFEFEKSRFLLVNPFMDVEKYVEVDDEYRAPPAEPYVEREHLRSWLADEYGRDQFALYADQELSVWWNETDQPAEKIKGRQNWTESYMQWSPLGSYMCTFHRQGLVLWGGPSWSKLMRFVHLNIKSADFSPSERYVVTLSSDPIDVEAVSALLGPENAHQNPYSAADQGNSVCIWDARTGALLRSFAPPIGKDGNPTKTTWPQFKWSPSETYFARMTHETSISIYQAPSMVLLDKKSLATPGIQDFSWCPSVLTDSRTGAARPELLAYWTPEEGNLPARVSLVSIPDRALVRTKNLFNVFAAALHWHPSGKMLCVRVQRFTKSKKSRFTNLEIFRTGERDVPVDVVELKDSAVAFDWEPTEDNFRFAILHTDDPTPPQTNSSGIAMAAVKTNVSFYSFERKGKLVKKEGFRLLNTLKNKSTTSLKWSPLGRYIILATLRTMTTCTLEFYDTDFDHSAANKSGNPGDAITLLASTEHYGITDLEWDPTGRYVLTSASSWRHSMENGYVLWDFKGQMLHKVMLERFKQIHWRPRPRSLLTEEQKRQVRKDLKTYAREFDEMDERKLHAADAQLMTQRRRLVSEWETWREQVGEFLEKETEDAVADGYKLPIAADNEDLVVEEIVEEIVEEKEEVIS